MGFYWLIACSVKLAVYFYIIHVADGRGCRVCPKYSSYCVDLDCDNGRTGKRNFDMNMHHMDFHNMFGNQIDNYNNFANHMNLQYHFGGTDSNFRCADFCHYYMYERKIISGKEWLKIIAPANTNNCGWVQRSDTYCENGCCDTSLPTIVTHKIPQTTNTTKALNTVTQNATKSTISPNKAQTSSNRSKATNQPQVSNQPHTTNQAKATGQPQSTKKHVFPMSSAITSKIATIGNHQTQWIGPCIDTRNDCSSYRNYCSTFETWEKKTCPLTCGFCKASATTIAKPTTSAQKWITVKTQAPTTTPKPTTFAPKWITISGKRNA